MAYVTASLGDAGGRTRVAKGVAWRLRPGALLGARLAYEVELDPGPRPFPLTISWSRIELANADMRLPAAALGLGVPKLAPLGLTGDVLINVPSLSVARDGIDGNATLQWRAAGSALSRRPAIEGRTTALSEALRPERSQDYVSCSRRGFRSCGFSIQRESRSSDLHPRSGAPAAP